MKYIALHHTAVSREKNPTQLYAVNRYHKDKWGMKSDLGWYGGYNFFCDSDGTRTQYRRVGEETIAQVGHNCDAPERCDTISYCMAGDFNIETPSEAQWKDFKLFFEEMREQYPGIEIKFHRDLQPARTCPGKNLTEGTILGRILDTQEEEPEEDAEKRKMERKILIMDQLIVLMKKLLQLLSAQK